MIPFRMVYHTSEEAISGFDLIEGRGRHGIKRGRGRSSRPWTNLSG